jgi:hypothetical protein
MRSIKLQCIFKHKNNNKQRSKQLKIVKTQKGVSHGLIETTSGEEIKFYNFPLHSVFPSIGTTPQYSSVTAGVTNGTALPNRVGNSIRVKAFGFYGTLEGGQSNLATDDEYNVIRISLIEVQYQTMAATITPGTYNVSSVLDPRTFPGLINVIHDEVITLSSPGRDSTGYMSAVKQLNVRKKLDLLVPYSGAAAYSDTSKSLVMLIVSDSAVVSNPGFVTGQEYVEFTDA